MFEVPVELPLTPAKLLSVIEGRDMAGAADYAKPKVSEMAVADADIEAPSPQAAALSSVSAQAAPAAPPAEVPIDGEWNMVLATPMGAQEMRADPSLGALDAYA
jgi:hypothetical protein